MKTFGQHILTEAFTKQHYEAIADAIKDAYLGGDPDLEEAFHNFAKTLAIVFMNDNRLFNKAKFFAQCGW